MHYCFPFKPWRCEAFHIGRKSRFDVKSMAGNIIPAIATTNAEIGGLIVQEALKILGGGVENIRRLCRTVRRGEKRIYYSRFESLHCTSANYSWACRTEHFILSSLANMVCPSAGRRLANATMNILLLVVFKYFPSGWETALLV